MSELWTGSDLAILGMAASGMRDQRFTLDLAARNVAAAQASTPDHPYARLVADAGSARDAATIADVDDRDGDEAGDADAADLLPGALSESVDRSARLPGVHREAGTGDALTEMIAVLDAQRAYEQNASVFDVGKRLAERTIDIGRG